MAVYYILLFSSALIFSGQFLITKQYQLYNGTSFRQTVKLSFFAYLTIAAFFFIKGCITENAFVFGFSWFTFGMTLGVAVVSMASVYMGVKALSIGDMSVYSVFMMLGSLIMPTLVGLIFYHEQLTWLKGIAILAMIGAVVLSVGSIDKSRLKAKAFLYYIGVFIMNGLVGVLFTVHQNQPALSAGAHLGADGSYVANNDIFMTWYGLSTVLLAGVVLAVLFAVRRVRRNRTGAALGNMTTNGESSQTDIPGGLAPAKGKHRVSAAMRVFLLLIPVLYGLCNGLGDYFIALGTAPGALGSSVTFPIINGGTILFSTIIGWTVCREKFRWKTLLSLVVVIAASIVFMFVT